MILQVGQRVTFDAVEYCAQSKSSRSTQGDVGLSAPSEEELKKPIVLVFQKSFIHQPMENMQSRI